MMRYGTTWPISVFLSASLIIGLGACGDDVGFKPPGERLRSGTARDRTPDITPEQKRDLVNSNTQFALELHTKLSDDADNVFVSPLSISTVLVKTYGGARGDTAEQMARTLHFDTLPQDALHAGFNWLDLQLNRRDKKPADAVILRFANAVFGQTGHRFEPSYLQLLSHNYGEGMQLLDFANQPEDSRKGINNWVGRVTSGRVPELLPLGVISTETRLLVVNAVYFKAPWEHPFRKEDTQEQTFHAAGEDIPVSMMTGKVDSMRYTEGADYQAASLPYEGGKHDMVIIMPRDELAGFESGLDADKLTQIFGDLAASEYNAIAMPKFNFRFKVDLVGTLREMGMIDAFVPRVANFSGMDGTRDLVITSVVHEAFVDVNEEGTEAAAASASVITTTSLPRTLIIDRPFLFVIRDIQTNTVIFLGRVIRPSYNAP